MVGFLLWDPYFFGYDSKLLGLGINGQVMSFQDMCQLAIVTAASTRVVAASTEVVTAFTGVVAAFARTIVVATFAGTIAVAAGATTASIGAVAGIFV